jgi:sulfur-oxidizing protein SoxA
MTLARHCEERSDEAIQKGGTARLDCFASLAMTVKAIAVIARSAARSPDERSEIRGPAFRLRSMRATALCRAVFARSAATKQSRGLLPQLDCFASLAMTGMVLTTTLAPAAEIPPGERRSGFDLMSPQTQAMQRDDTANPGMLWVGEGEALWNAKAGAAEKACADCHGDAAQSMRGVAARYPAFSAARQAPIDLAGQINLCRESRQQATPFRFESQELLALTTYVAHQSRGLPIVADDERLAPFRERGRAHFEARQGQLNFSCGNCHDDNWGKRLAGNVIPQAHPTGYPIYRLEWQGMGSLQRRLRNCLTGVRAEPYPFGAPELVELELYLNWRARGMPVETPGVRP